MLFFEDFKEVLEFLPLGFLAKFLIPKQCFAVLLQFVDERDRVEAEVRAGEIFGRTVAFDLAALDMRNARAAERLARLARVTAVEIGRAHV